ncbi:MAG: hypothetical protein EOO98_08155 [Pedobacter sp.]|nr:MAG: hypothetical protein EOO98_08155 [Pedobacter sp.]
MDLTSESTLSTELQELYLQNKEWMSQVCFLEDESRFYQKLFGAKLFYIGKKHTAREIYAITENLTILGKRTTAIKDLVIKHQHMLEGILKTEDLSVGMNLIEEHSKLTADINEQLLANRIVKSDLFRMVEGVD